jgi:hypothetical protein
MFKWLLRFVALALVLTGLFGVFLQDLIGLAIPDTPDLEAPVWQIDDVALAPDGTILLALPHPARIQLYSRDGRFIRSFPVRTSGGAFAIDISNGRLLTYVHRRNVVEEMTMSGQVVQTTKLTDGAAYAAAAARDDRVRAVSRNAQATTIEFTDGDPPLTISYKPWHYLAPGAFLSRLIFGMGFVLFLVTGLPRWRSGN